jgi:hypothetical protein
VEQQPADAAAKAIAFANGLRKNVIAAGRRWSQWPAGANDLRVVTAAIDRITDRLTSADDDAAVAACIADLRSVLEWTTYQSGSIATARALLFARKTRMFAQRFGLREDRVSGLAMLSESEESLLENIATKNGYMRAIAERSPHLALPDPLIVLETLVPKPKTPGKLALIQQLMQTAKRPPRAK